MNSLKLSDDEKPSQPEIQTEENISTPKKTEDIEKKDSKISTFKKSSKKIANEDMNVSNEYENEEFEEEEIPKILEKESSDNNAVKEFHAPPILPPVLKPNIENKKLIDVQPEVEDKPKPAKLKYLNQEPPVLHPQTDNFPGISSTISPEKTEINEKSTEDQSIPPKFSSHILSESQKPLKKLNTTTEK